jgi:membrane protein DedA with SNARE-associated domain
MPSLHELLHIDPAHGYWVVALLIALESLGLPLPGETVLIAAAIYAGSRHGLNIGLVIAAAAFGAIVGNIAGFWIGRRGGYRLLLRHGHRVRLTPARIKLGQYLFRSHGGKIVFFSRFVAILRAFGALLAGANRMSWRPFVLYTVAGSVVWATLYGMLAYYLGAKINELTKYAGYAAAAVAIAAVVAAFLFLKKRETELQRRAEEAMPGPLESP